MKARIVSVTQTVYCKCGGRLTLTGAPHGVETGIRLWTGDHRGPGHAPMTKGQFQKMKREQAMAASPAYKDPQERLF